MDHNLPLATTVTGVRDHLLDVFNKLRDGEIEPKDAVELNNTAGKIISSIKMQLAYHSMRQEKPEIPFLNDHPTTKTIENKTEVK